MAKQHNLEVTLSVGGAASEVIGTTKTDDVFKTQQRLLKVFEHLEHGRKSFKAKAAAIGGWAEAVLTFKVDGGAPSDGGTHSSATFKFQVPATGGAQAIKDACAKVK